MCLEVSLETDPAHAPGGCRHGPAVIRWWEEPTEVVPERRPPDFENDVLKSFLHNPRTANAFKTQSTGHAGRGGYTGTIDVSPSSMLIAFLRLRDRVGPAGQ